MRTKTLLALAVLAAGVATSMAQSNVYSLNIVGYANVPVPVGFTFHSNPFDNGNNGANVVIPNPNPGGGGLGPWDGAEIHEWVNVGFKVSVFDSLTDDTTTGFTDRNGSPVPIPVLSSGKGYLMNNPGTSNNITYIGNVRGPGTNTLTYPGSSKPYAVGSTLPLAGTPFQLGFTNGPPDGVTGLGPLDGVEIQTLVRAPNGQGAGYLVRVFDSLTDDTTTGFTDRNGSPQPAPQIAIGQGFFLNNPNSGTVTWKQVLTNSP
jgi:hypothetical protein